jgi:hypothetical protein
MNRTDAADRSLCLGVDCVEHAPKLRDSPPVSVGFSPTGRHLVDQSQRGLFGERARRVAWQCRYGPAQPLEIMGFHAPAL